MERVGRLSRSRGGQTSTEYMLIISVVTIAVTGAAYQFVPLFGNGVDALGRDVARILGNQQIGGVGGVGGGQGGGAGDVSADPMMNNAPGDLGAPADDSLHNTEFSTNDQMVYDNKIKMPWETAAYGDSMSTLMGNPQTAEAPPAAPKDQQLARLDLPEDLAADRKRSA